MAGKALPVIVTRAQPGAAETADRLGQIGHYPVLSPVLTLKANADGRVPLPEALTGLIFTSANGVRCYADRSKDRLLPAWCVGPATAKAAHEAGFETVFESAGNAIDLANYIASRSLPAERPLLHVANTAAKGDLKAALKERGFAVQFCPLYDMLPAKELSVGALEALQSGSTTALLIHSAKGAEAFATLAKDLNTEHLIGIAISDQAARPLARLNPRTMQVAHKPNEDGLFDALSAAIATLSA